MKTLLLDMARCLGMRMGDGAEICPERGSCLRYLTIERERLSMPVYEMVSYHSMLRVPGHKVCADRIAE